MSLVQPANTRWTSHYRAVRAVVKCLQSIVATLQHIHKDSGDLSSEAGGLLLTFQDRKSIVVLFAVKDILALKLQCDIPDLQQFSIDLQGLQRTKSMRNTSESLIWHYWTAPRGLIE